MSSPKLRLPKSGIILLCIFMLGLALRVLCLDCYSLWGDEVASIAVASKGLGFIFDSRFGWLGNQTIGHYLLTWLTLQPVDAASTSFLARLPSALAGALLSLAVYGIAKELFNHRVAIVSSLLIALSTIGLDYSHDLRPYSLLAFLTATSVYCLLRADSTNSLRWWCAFTALTILNILNSYMAVTMALLSLTPYFVYVLWEAWKNRQKDAWSKLRYVGVAYTLIVITGAVMMLDLLASKGASPNWSNLSLTGFIRILLANLSSFTNLGLTEAFSSAISLAFILLALLGAYFGIRTGYHRGVFLCGSVITLASFALAILDTVSVISTRYILFIGPFYYMLISLGPLLAIRETHSNSKAKTETVPTNRRPVSMVGMVCTSLILALFLWGVYNYMNHGTHANLSYRPDFRGAAKYLAQTIEPDDLIVLGDDPPLGFSVISFYRPQLSASMFDVRDPRLYNQAPEGEIYWVVSSLNTRMATQLHAAGHTWKHVETLEGVVILQEDVDGRSTVDIVYSMVNRLGEIEPSYQPVITMDGTAQQAEGELEQAAQTYKSAGIYFPIGSEYLQAAEGLAERGFVADALRQGLIAKFMEPARPEIRRSIAQYLQILGYVDESRSEQQIAEMLTP